MASQSWSASGATITCCPAGDPSVGATWFHIVDVFQGDDPNTPGEEPSGTVRVVDRSYWVIPWNSSEVYTYVPSMARNVTVTHVAGGGEEWSRIYLPGEHISTSDPEDTAATGWMEEGNYTGFVYWRFPESARRAYRHRVDVNNSTDFISLDETLTVTEDWDYFGGRLALLPDRERSTFHSSTIDIGLDILSVEMTLEGRSTGNMSFEVSQDGGLTWVPLDEGVATDLTGAGHGFKWRVEFTQHQSMDQPPVLERVVFDLVVAPETNHIWLETRYLLDIPPSGLDFSITLPFDGEWTGLYMHVYTDEGVRLEVNGTDLEPVSGQGPGGKVVHRHVAGGYASLISLSVGGAEPEGDGGAVDPLDGVWPPVVAATIVVAVALVALLRRRGARRGGGPDARQEDGE